MMKTILLLAGLAFASASCPNDCNGHGTCNVYSACECYRNWMSADCSERVCYFGHAFVDTPQGDLNADGRTDVTTATYRVILGSNHSFFSSGTASDAAVGVTAFYKGRDAPTWNAVTGKTEGASQSNFSLCQDGNGDYESACSTAASNPVAVENDITTEYTLASITAAASGYQQDDIYGYVEACQGASQADAATIQYAIAFDIETTPTFVPYANGGKVKQFVGKCADISGNNCALGTPHATDNLLVNAVTNGTAARLLHLCTMYSSTYSVQWSNKKEWERYPTDHGHANPTPADKNIWDEAHFYRECSNKGTCNRQTGQCECYAGYEGEGCARTTCPNECSGHGTCRRAVDVHDGYMAWDAYKTQSCKCDSGYTGPDCSLRLCPSGDDPISRINDVNEIQTFTLPSRATIYDHGAPNAVLADGANPAAASGAGMWFALDFEDEFGDHWITKNINLFSEVGGAACTSRNPNLPSGCKGSVLADDIEAALEALPNNVIEDVEVSVDMSGNTNANVAFSVTFLHNSGDIPLLGARYSFGVTDSNGNAAAKALASDPFSNTALGKFASPWTTSSVDGNKENVQCSNRGLCDQASGICKCFAGYTDYDCSRQNALSAN